MTVDKTGVFDKMIAALGFGRPRSDGVGIVGHGSAVLTAADGRILQVVRFRNLVTQVGDQMYGDAYAGLHTNATVTDPPAVTGMRVGTGTTAVAKTGAGAAIVTYVSSITASKAIAATYPQSSLSGSSRRITWQTVWAAGEATQNGLAEVVITNETPLTDVAGTAANTVARALLSPVVNKGASDQLTVTWHHDLLGA